MRPADDWVRDPGSCLRDFRKERGLTLKEAAFLFETSISNLSDIEHGTHDPSLPLLRNMLWWQMRSTKHIHEMVR